MTTAMSAHQEPPIERLGPPTSQAWQPKRNKRKDFKPRCAPAEELLANTAATIHDTPVAYSPNSKHEDDEDLDEELRNEDGRDDDRDAEEPHPKRIYKGAEAVDLSGRRLSTDSNENIESNDIRQNPVLGLLEQQKRLDALRSLSISSQFQQSYIQSLQLGQNLNKNPALTPSEYKTKNFSTKSPFAISQLIKTNSPTRRRIHSNASDVDDDDSLKNDENGSHDNEGSGDDNNRDKDEPMDVEDGGEEDVQNGEAPPNNRMLTDYAVNTMKELLGIYGLSSNEVADALSGQAAKHYPLWLQRRWTQGALGPLGPLGMMAAQFPEDSNPVSPIDAHKANSIQEDSGSGMDSDGERTLDLSVSKDNDVQDLSTTSSAGNSVTDFEQQSMLMRRNLEDLAGLHGIFSKPQSSMDNDDSSGDMRAKLSPAALLAHLNQLEGRRQSSVPPLDYSRYVKRFSSALECGSSYCKDLGYREHFHCLDCSGRVFCKKEEMIRHFKWHKKRDESLAHGFMRYSPLDDCGERGPGCPHNRSQTHYHCIQDGCDKVYISTSDVQMHANYHRKDSAILQEGFQRFRATEKCSAPHCAFRGQRTTHFHCRRPQCLYTFKNKADMEKHKTYHIKDEQLARDGFKKYMKNEPCPYRDCRFSRMCNHIHCIRPRCNYVLHSSSQLFSHKRKHERKDQEMTYGIPSGVGNSLYQSPEDSPMKGKLSSSPPPEGDDSSMGPSFPSTVPPLLPIHTPPQGDEELPLNQVMMEELSKKYIHTFNGGTDPDDKCHRCSAFNKHYHCLVEDCSMAHSCHSTMLKHALEHEHQSQVTEAYFQTFTKANPCPSSSCHHIRDQTHFHCTWENCGCVILPSEEHPFRRLEHHRQHALLSPLSPNLGRLAQALNPNPLQGLTPNLPHSLVPNPFQNFAPNALQNIPPSILQTLPPSVLQNLTPSLLQNLNPALLQGLSPSVLSSLNSNNLQSHNPGHTGPASSLDEMFSRKRGRPPKNRVVEVWADHATPQAIFTSFKLPKSSQASSLPPSPSDFSKIKFQHFDAYMAPDACASSHPACQIRSSRIHVHCSHCAFTTEDHASLEVHSRETHSVNKLLDTFEYYQSCEDCNVTKCIKAALRGHFHCNAPNCSSVVTQYSALLGHKHKSQEDDSEAGRKGEEIRDYSMKARDVVATLEGFHGGNLTVKNDNAEESPNTSVSVVKAAGTFYPLSGISPSASPSPSHSRPPSSCQACLLRPPDQQDLPCVHTHNNNNTQPAGLAATKETLEREYPEISILPSTASPSPSPSTHQRQSQTTQDGQTTPTSAQTSSRSTGSTPSQCDPPPLSQAVHNLLLHQYLAQTSAKPPNIPDHIKYHPQMAFLRSPFPLYPGMMYPPELLMEQSPLLGPTSSALAASLAQDKEAADLANKRVHSMRGPPNLRMMKDEPIPEGYLRFRFNEDCAYQHCGYREHQTHFHCTRRDCGYSFCDKTRFVQHTARHERLDTLMGGDFQQYRANVFCGRQDCAHATNFGSTQNKASHFHCLKCDFVCTDTNKVVAHRRQHQKMDSIQAAGFEKFPPSKGCGFDPQCIHSKKQTHYHCLQCGFAVLGLSQMTSHKYRHQEMSAQQGAGPSNS